MVNGTYLPKVRAEEKGRTTPIQAKGSTLKHFGATYTKSMAILRTGVLKIQTELEANLEITTDFGVRPATDRDTSLALVMPQQLEFKPYLKLLLKAKVSRNSEAARETMATETGKARTFLQDIPRNKQLLLCTTSHPPPNNKTGGKPPILDQFY
jgi:hypothetical protein